MSESASTNATRVSLIGRIIERDEAAWRTLVDLYGPLISRWCRQCGLDSHARADVIQEVFLSVSKSIGQFDSPLGFGAFRGWLWKITRHKIIDRGRKAQRTIPSAGGSSAIRLMNEVAEPYPIPDDEPTDARALDDLMRLGLAQLEREFHPSTWQAFWRSAVDGIPTAVVAEELRLTSANVRQARSRVFRRLRHYLGELDDREN